MFLLPVQLLRLICSLHNNCLLSHVQFLQSQTGILSSSGASAANPAAFCVLYLPQFRLAAAAWNPNDCSLGRKIGIRAQMGRPMSDLFYYNEFFPWCQAFFSKNREFFHFSRGAAWFRLHFCASRTTDLTFPRRFVETSCHRRNVSRKRLDFFHNSCYNKIILLSAFVCPEMGKWQQKSTHSNRICFDFPIFREIFPCRCSRT